MERVNKFLRFLALAVCLVVSKQALAYNNNIEINKADKTPGPGIYFYRLEPSFYTGFAPRIQEPERIMVNLGRGNQLRITAVLSEQIIDEYLSDLVTRYQVYRELIDTGQLKLTQNLGYEQFEETMKNEDIVHLHSQRDTVKADVYRETSLELLKKLNPGKVFHIKIDLKKRIEEWSQQLNGYKKSKLLVDDNLLELINDMLPTRLKVTALSPQLKKEVLSVIKSYEMYKNQGDQKSWDSFYMQARQIYFEDTILRSGTDLIVSDSPVFLQWFYARHHVAPGQDAMFMSGREFETMYPSLNILLTRPEDVDYQAEGRYEDHEQAKAVDDALKELLSDIAYITFKEFSYRNREEIVIYVKEKLEL